MSNIKIQTVEKNANKILEKVGKEPFVDWNNFTQGSADVVRAIEELNSSIAEFRDCQHKKFIQTMKKLKSLDLPDLLQAVQNKKLPKQALRAVLPRFKEQGEELHLVESADTLRENAKKEYEQYMDKNKYFIQEMKKYTQFFNTKIEESGFKQTVTLPEAIKSTVKFNLSEDLASKIASQIQIQYLQQSNQLISIKTYSQIVDGTFRLISDQYKKLTDQCRKKSRELMSKPAEYYNSLNEYLNNTQALINQGQATLARKVGVTEKKLGESELFMMERGMGQNLMMIQSGLRGKIKESIKSDKDVSVETAKEIIEYQVKMIEQKGGQIDGILSNMDKGPETLQMVPMLLALILNDYVFEKYGYEEEDFMKNLDENAITTNPDFMKIFKDMEMGIMKLMQKLQVIPPEVAKMMEQQQAFFQQMGQQGMPGMGDMMGIPGMGMPGMMPPGPQGGMPPLGGIPGMGSSTNPMDMLQMQQMQQMQQMFGMMQPPQREEQKK